MVGENHRAKVTLTYTPVSLINAYVSAASRRRVRCRNFQVCADAIYVSHMSTLPIVEVKEKIGA